MRRYFHEKYLLNESYTNTEKPIKLRGKYDYRQVSNIRRTLVGNKIVNHWCSWSIACQRCSNYIWVIDLTPGFIGLGKDNSKTRRETFKFWDLVCIILKILQYSQQKHTRFSSVLRLEESSQYHGYRCPGILPWWRHQMETFSALLAIFGRNSPVPGEFPAQRAVTLSFDVFFDLRLNKRLSKQSWGWWFETPSLPLWRHRNASSSHLQPWCWEPGRYHGCRCPGYEVISSYGTDLDK